MDRRSFLYAVSVIRVIRQHTKMGWTQLANDEHTRLDNWLRDRGYCLEPHPDFTYQIVKARPADDREVYQHPCKYCDQLHPLEYQVQSNSTRHLVYRCPSHRKSKTAVEFLAFIPDLPIPEFKSHRSQKTSNRLAPIGEGSQLGERG